MHLTLRAQGVGTGIDLFKISVSEDGHWTYESRAVEHVEGQLGPEDVAQLVNLYAKVDWDKHVLNAPVSADDRTLFKLDVIDGAMIRTYQFSEAVNHASWQFRDLVHFLRHHVALKGDPVGWSPEPPGQRPPEVHP